MRSTTTYERGEVIVVNVPYSDHSGVKPRPALVVSGEAFHALLPDLIVCPISSQVRYHRRPGPKDHPPSEWRKVGLRRPSTAHALAEERSLELHREIATRLLRDRRILETARVRIEERLREGGPSRPWFERWREILERSPEDVAAFLIDPSEEARALRQSTPFAGIVPPRERWRIWREVRERRMAT